MTGFGKDYGPIEGKETELAMRFRPKEPFKKSGFVSNH